MNNAPTVVLIAGKKRSGKDTISDFLAQELRNSGKKVAQMAFADPIKHLLCTTFGISREELDRLKNENDEIHLGDRVTCMREILEKFGTDAMQGMFGPEIWTQIAVEEATKVWRAGAEFIIFSDFRFPAESQIADIAICVENHDLDSVHSIHPAENSLSMFPFDAVVDNTGKQCKQGDIREIAVSAMEIHLQKNIGVVD